jgi:hypothetical protein
VTGRGPSVPVRSPRVPLVPETTNSLLHSRVPTDPVLQVECKQLGYRSYRSQLETKKILNEKLTVAQMVKNILTFIKH